MGESGERDELGRKKSEALEDEREREREMNWTVRERKRKWL